MQTQFVPKIMHQNLAVVLRQNLFCSISPSRWTIVTILEFSNSPIFQLLWSLIYCALFKSPFVDEKRYFFTFSSSSPILSDNFFHSNASSFQSIFGGGVDTSIVCSIWRKNRLCKFCRILQNVNNNEEWGTWRPTYKATSCAASFHSVRALHFWH